MCWETKLIMLTVIRNQLNPFIHWLLRNFKRGLKGLRPEEHPPQAFKKLQETGLESHALLIRIAEQIIKFFTIVLLAPLLPAKLKRLLFYRQYPRLPLFLVATK